MLECDLSSNELTGHVDFSDFNRTWPECSSDVNASKCVKPYRNSKYFSFDVPARCVTATKKCSLVQIQNGFSQEPIGISKKPHALC